MTSVPLNGAFTDPSAVPVPDLRGIGAPPGRDGKNVRFQKTATHIQWAYVGSEDWIDLVAIEEISGEDGDQVSLRATETYIQWRIGEGDWTNLVAVDDLIGPVPVLGLGTVTTGDPGTEVEVSLLPNEQGIYLFNFTIPRGEGNVYGPGESAIGELPLFGGVDGKVLARSNVIVTAFILSLLGAADETSALAALGAAPVDSALQTGAIGVLVQAYDAATAKTDAAQTFTKPQRGAVTALTVSSGAIDWTLADGNDFAVTLTANAVFNLPSDIAAHVGQKGRILFTQDGTGGRTLAVNVNFIPLGSVDVPEIPTDPGTMAYLAYDVISATQIAFTLTGVGE